MIIQCQECRTKFDLDEALLKDEGSKVRCSVCKHEFEVYPPSAVFPEQAQPAPGDFEESEVIDEELPAETREEALESERRDEEIDFDKIFEDSLEDLDRLEGGEGEELLEPEREEGPRREVPPEDAPPVPPKDAKAKADEGYPEQGEDIVPYPDQERHGRSHFLTIFLVIILLLVGAGAAVVFWAPGLIPESLSILKPSEKREVADTGARLLSLRGVTGAFLESKEAGQLFVIRGLIKNKYSKGRSFILVKGTILDDKGKVVKQELAYAGNTFKVDELKMLPMGEIKKAMENRFGKARVNFNVAPGSTVPFMIVFENLPANLREFTVEAVSSSPGT